MRLEIDNTSDSLYFRLHEKKIVESEEVQPGVILDYDENNQVVGVEFLTVSKRATSQELSPFSSTPLEGKKTEWDNDGSGT